MKRGAELSFLGYLQFTFLGYRGLFVANFETLYEQKITYCGLQEQIESPSRQRCEETVCIKHGIYFVVNKTFTLANL